MKRTSWKRKHAVLAATAIILSALLLGGCVGRVSRVHVDDEPIVDVMASDVDIRAMSRKMATAIIELPIISNAPEPVVIAFRNIENRTYDPDFSSYDLLSRIRLELMKHAGGKAVFVDQKSLDSVYAERDRKRAGQATSKGQKDLPGTDYFLTGFAYSDRKHGKKGKVLASHRYTFRLTDAETSVLVWEDDYEFKKHGQAGIDDR